MPGPHNGLIRYRRNDQRDRQIFEEWIHGASQTELARKHNITQPRVWKIVSVMEDRLTKELAERIEHEKARQTFQLQKLYFELRDSWEKSRQGEETTKVSTSDKSGHRAEKITNTKPGDAIYAVQMRGVLADIRRIWGLDQQPERGEGGELPTVQVVIVGDRAAYQRVIDVTELEQELIGNGRRPKELPKPIESVSPPIDSPVS